MAQLISPRLLRRGLEIFLLISALGFGGLLLYGNNFSQFVGAMSSLRWEWLAAGVALASLDWLGGGLRVWVLVRHLHPAASLKGSILAGGLNTWAGYLTPSQAGGGPMMIYVLKRYGTPLPESVIATFISFVATVLFFAIAGPLAVFLGAGRSLQQHGILGRGFTLYDLFNISLTAWVSIGLVMGLALFFPGLVHGLAQRLVTWLERRGSARLARHADRLRDGLDRAHECMEAFLKARGWMALGLAVVLSALAHANRLVAGYVVLRMLGIEVNFFDVLLLQTLITFLLYFAPTPGGSGLAELLSAAVMSIYVPRALTPSYILLWRVIVSYLTVAFGSFVFWRMLKSAEIKDDSVLGEQQVPI